MKDYELTVLIHPDLEMDIEKPLSKIRGIITDNGGEIVKETSWGKKKLAYTIKKEDFAVYINFDLKLPAAALTKISTIFNITDELLRYLIVSTDDKTKAKIAEANERAAKNESREGERGNG